MSHPRLDPVILDWAQAAAAGPQVVGGKGYNLGRLHRYGFLVPPGGVVAASVYDELMSAPTLREIRRSLEPVGPEDVGEAPVADRLSHMRQAIADQALPQQFLAELDAFLVRQGLADVPLAVRSSATAEDGDAASFAGIHESFLHVLGTGAIVAAIKRCYASLWTPRAIAYRRRLGLSDDEVRAAVVLCRMVADPASPSGQPAAAGVAFSCDPRTGNHDVITIGAVKGLGHSLVSGLANPEEITVPIAPSGRPKSVERRPASLASPEEVLTDPQVRELARLVWRIHWVLGDGQDPQDVEWAYDGSRFWLLQARPVTRLPRLVPKGAETLPAVWSNANLKDALPMVLSPLGWSLIRPIVRENLFAPHKEAGHPPPRGIEAIRRFGGRAYFDLTTMAWMYYDTFGIMPDELNRMLGGHQPELPIAAAKPLKGPEGRRRLRARLKLNAALRRFQKEAPKAIDQVYADVERLKSIDPSGLSPSELIDLLDEVTVLATEFYWYAMMSNTSGGVWQTMLEIPLKRIAPGRSQALAAALMSGSGGVVSAEHGFRLYELAQAALEDPDALAYLEGEPLDPAGWRRLPPASPFRRSFEQFLSEFGHRGVYEVDVANPRWNEDPTYLLRQVRTLVQEGKREGRLSSPRELAQERRAAAEREVAERARVLRPVIYWLARKARAGFALREAAKSALVAFLEPTRAIALEIGRRMVEGGVLDRVKDVFCLTRADVDAYLLGLWDGRGARELVADRRAQMKEWQKETPPDVIVVDGEEKLVMPVKPVPHESGPSPAVPSGRGRGELAGVGVSAGQARGKVRILTHPDQGDLLQKGEILVAPSTDPGWTPLFLRAAGVAMEVGGYHSHGAIVSREFGIPAVANIPGLLKSLKDGEEVLVDGDAGKIIRLG